jgi:hypothetical protein
VLRLNAERVNVLEVVMGAQRMRIEALEMRVGRSLASMDGAF